MRPPIVWSDAAKALFALTAPTAVSAGAGSGKTTCLVELCVRLLAGEAGGAPCDPGEIVAITFTEKAAEELAERLRGAVEARARSASPGDAAAWRGRLRGLDRMAVGTIHGFAARLLRDHAIEAGLDPAFEVLDEETAAAWRRAAAREAVVAALDEGDGGACLLCAAHGADGRRGGLAGLVADIARERATLGEARPPAPADDREAEALAARGEALAAADALLALRAAVHTASGAAAIGRLAGARAEAAALLAGPLAIASIARVTALGAAVRCWRVGSSDGDAARAARDRLAAACDAFAPLAAEALAGPAKRALCALVAAAEARYAAAKRAARALDFDDLLAMARDLLRGDAPLRAELRGRWRSLLVDEYQDVNPAQQEIFDLLAGGEGARPTLVAVGDLKQSIYRFRGADVSVFKGLLERFAAAPPARVLHLADNHRSRPAVLALVNEVFARCMQPGPGARPYELAFTEADRLRPVRRDGEVIAAELLADPGEGNAAERRAREARAIAARVAALASGAAGVTIRDRGAPEDAPGRRPRFEDVAVLFRRLTQVGEYERALRESGIPYRLARGGGFYQAPEVRDLGELAASLADPSDALAWASILRSPLCAVSDAALVALSQMGFGSLARRSPEESVRALAEAYPLAREAWPEIGGVGSRETGVDVEGAGGGAREEGEGFARRVPRTSTEADRLHRFLTVWHELHALQGRVPLGDLLAAAAERLDLEAAHLASPEGERRAANLRKALALARRLGARGETVAAFAERLRGMAERPPRESEAEIDAGDAVALLSVHQAKGLEWPIVFVPDLGAPPPRDARRALRGHDGLIACALHDPAADVHHPTATLEAARAEARRAAAAETRRLLYVALTRARDRLVLSGEAGRGAGETWRALLEPGLAALPELVERIPMAEAGTWRSGGDGESSDAVALHLGPAPLPDPLPARRGEGGAGRLDHELDLERDADRARVSRSLFPRTSPSPFPSPSPSPAHHDRAPARLSTLGIAPPRLAPAVPVPTVSLAVTELAEHARCPRRVFLARHLGLAEPGRGGAPSRDDPDRATARGTLAHAMVAEIDLGAPPLERRAQLDGVARRRGYDPRSRGVRQILGDITRFLDSAAGRALAAASRAGTLRREVPFVLRIDGDGEPSCYLVGAVDALVEAKREVAVIDFKYAMAHPEARERYRFQLLAYALAAGRAHPGRKVTARLQFLRGSCGAVDLTPSSGDLRRFAAEAPRRAAAAQAGHGFRATPAELGRTEARCRAERCGFAARCFATILPPRGVAAQRPLDG